MAAATSSRSLPRAGMTRFYLPSKLRLKPLYSQRELSQLTRSCKSLMFYSLVLKKFKSCLASFLVQQAHHLLMEVGDFCLTKPCSVEAEEEEGELMLWVRLSLCSSFYPNS